MGNESMNMNKIVAALTGLGIWVGAMPSALATGFVNLPAGGVAVPGGTSAYVTCNTSGGFGANPDGSTPPTPNANNTCAIFRADDNRSPLSGYVRTAQVKRDIVMKNAYTRNRNITVGTVIDEVWRKGTNCVYGMKIQLDNVDYDVRSANPGRQYFEINDVMRGGFRGRGPISIAYHYSKSAPASDEVLYRAGLTFTSVVAEENDPPQPLTSIAPISTNWVDFTLDLNYLDPDGSSVRDSPWLFVRSTCTTATPTEVGGILRFRQMGQEDQPQLEVRLPGFAPAGATNAP